MKIFGQRLRQHKSGSLELSINAIVMLVMAMVVLGLGLAFIRGMFDKGTRNLGGVLDNTKIENPASYDQPLTIDRTIMVKATRGGQFDVGFYNKENYKVQATPTTAASGTRFIGCMDSQGQTNVFRLSSPAAYVESGSAVGFKIIIMPVERLATTDFNPDNYAVPTGTYDKVTAGTYICTLEMNIVDQTVGGNAAATSLSTQFAVEVSG